MREQPNFWGEIHEDEIVKIAREAAEKRGYAIYDDFEEYFEQRKVREGLKVLSWNPPEVMSEIKETLKAAGWTRRKVCSKTRFYPPGTEFSKGDQMELFEGQRKEKYGPAPN